MRAVVQRVRSASVHVADETIATIGPGLAVMLGVAADDRPEDGERVAAKILALRIFDDGRGRLDRTLKDVAGSVLVIPQFTLYGRRAAWAAPGLHRGRTAGARPAALRRVLWRTARRGCVSGERQIWGRHADRP